MGFLVAGLVACVLTYLLVMVEILLRAKATFKATLNLPCLFYLVVLAFGNVLMTLLALPQLGGRISEPLRPWLEPALAAFAGCFGFHAALSNMNIKFFQRNILTFDDWIAKARALAAGAANEKQGDRPHERSNAVASPRA
jgi:hypothetical protein